VAEVLFGDYNPGGKLPFTVPRNVGQVPCYYNHTPYHGPINYYQSQGGPLYPFGFGLSYTTFEYADCKVTPAQIQPNQTATVSVTVRNSGSRPGDEVVQFYLRQDYTSLKRPEKELKGFKRITLQPGEKKTVEFPVGFEQVKFWKDGKWVSEPGQVQLLIGSSCADLRAKTKLTVSGL
jgi:beta-glucosidase